MKTQSILISLFLLTLATGFSQQPQSVQLLGGNVPSESLTKFDLDFPGGIPKELVSAIQTASGRPLNVIVPEEFGDIRLPALKMKNVDALQLFEALTSSSHKQEMVQTGMGWQSVATTSYGFRSQGGKVSDDTIWNFYAEKPKAPNQTTGKVCRFYSLAAYLEAGTTVDDITTAIKTGAAMLGRATGIQGETGPTISFHKDTKLLIAVGEPSKLEIIDSVLRALDSQAQLAAHSGRAVGQNEPAKDQKK